MFSESGPNAGLIHGLGGFQGLIMVIGEVHHDLRLRNPCIVNVDTTLFIRAFLYTLPTQFCRSTFQMPLCLILLTRISLGDLT